jgi:YD repeat-containing protein
VCPGSSRGGRRRNGRSCARTVAAVHAAHRGLACRTARRNTATGARHSAQYDAAARRAEQHSAGRATGRPLADRIRDDKDTGLAKFPFKAFTLNELSLEIVLLAHDVIVWTQALLLDGELANAEPKRLRYRLLHVAARLAFHGRRGKLRLQHDWPWAEQLLAAFQKLKALPAGTG